MNRKCLEGSSYLTGSPVDFQTILNVIRAGVAITARECLCFLVSRKAKKFPYGNKA